MNGHDRGSASGHEFSLNRFIDQIQSLEPGEIDARFLCKAMKHILENHDFTSAGKIIFYLCSKLTGATSGYVALLNKEKTNNDILFLEAGDKECFVDQSLPMPIRGFRAEVYKEQRTRYDNDFQNSKYVNLLPKGHVTLKNVLFAPLIIDGETVGLFGLGNKPDDFTEKDAETAASFAALASIALKNNRNLRQLEESEQEKNQLNKQKDRFFSIISHDLRAQFHNIRALSDILDKRYDKLAEDKILYFLHELNKAIHSTSKLFENMLLWSKLQLKSLKVEKNRLELSSLIGKAIEPLYDSAEIKKITLTLSSEKGVMIFGDEFQITTIIRNLVSNAIKFTPEGGTVFVDSRKSDGRVLITIADTGIGIPDDKLKSLFNPDNIIVTEGTKGETGTGLGLILCKEFVSLNEGKITAKSTIGKGTTFSVTFPIIN